MIKGFGLSICALAAMGAVAATSTDKLFIYFADGNAKGMPSEMLDNIELDPDGRIATFTIASADERIDLNTVDFLQFESSCDSIEVVFNDNGAVVRNPFAFEGVDIDCSDGLTTLTVDGLSGNTARNMVVVLKGSSDNGAFRLYAPEGTNLNFVLDNLTLSSESYPAIDLRNTAGIATLILKGNSSLADPTAYLLPEGHSASGCINAEGSLMIAGNGSLRINGSRKHGVNCEGAVNIGGEASVTVESSASDAFHYAEAFTLESGTLDLTPGSDAIDGNGPLTVQGGSLKAKVESNTSKGIKAGGAVIIAGGNLEFEMTGSVVVEQGDPTYCTAIKAKTDMEFSGGSLVINHSGEAGKGVSVDGNLLISGGEIDILVTGDGATYTNASNQSDAYSAACIKADGNLSITGGNIKCVAKGSAGKGINTDGELTIGEPGSTSGPVLDVTTNGQKFSEGSTSGGGWGGPGGGWGGGWGGPDGGDYANPKAIKAAGNLIVNSGRITVVTTEDGGEGLESKSTLTINGGDFELNTYDDAINASTAIVINGGRIYANASGNDGIDSNGTLTINGGLIISSGTTSPEEGFDCDQNQFKITGGIAIGLGGGTSSPTSSVCTQNSAIVTVSSASQGSLCGIIDSSGNLLASFTMPKNYSRSCTMLFTHPDLKIGSSYQVMTGGSISGGDSSTEWFGYREDAAWSGGTQAGSFSQTSTVTGSSGGGGRPF